MTPGLYLGSTVFPRCGANWRRVDARCHQNNGTDRPQSTAHRAEQRERRNGIVVPLPSYIVTGVSVFSVVLPYMLHRLILSSLLFVACLFLCFFLDKMACVFLTKKLTERDTKLQHMGMLALHARKSSILLQAWKNTFASLFGLKPPSLQEHCHSRASLRSLSGKIALSTP